MPADVRSIVHPWYKGVHEWKVKKVAKLSEPVKYKDAEQGTVEYNPKILLLESAAKGKVLWFNYWMSTDKTNHKMKYGGGPPMLEEDVFFKLIIDAIKKDMFSKQFLKALKSAAHSKLAK